MRKHQQTIQQIPKLRLFSLLHVFVATLGEGQNEAEVYFRCCNQLQLLLKVDPSAKLHFSKDRKKSQKVPGNLRNLRQLNFLRRGVGDTWGLIRSRPLNWDIYIVIELSTK